MLAARSTARACRLAPSSRTFATAASDLKVVGVDNGQATSAVTVLVKAGSRYETTPGAAHALKNFAFKGTNKRSALRITRESELYGGVLSATLGREYLALTAEFLRGDEEYFVDVLADVVSGTKFVPHELKETVGPQTKEETLTALADPATAALDAAHALAFRNGLGNSLFAHGGVLLEEVKAYASKAFAQGNIALVASGVSESALQQLASQKFASLSSSGSLSSSATKYYGGETRIGGAGKPTVFIGYGTSSPSPAFAVLASYLDPTPSVKWSEGTSELSKLADGATAQVVNETYSDGGLFGILVQAPTVEAVKAAAVTAVKALQSVSSGSVEGDGLKKAVSKAKFAAASTLEGREGLATVFAPQLLVGSSTSLDGALSALDGVDSSALAKATKSLLEAKPTYVVVGDVARLPYADEVGL